MKIIICWETSGFCQRFTSKHPPHAQNVGRLVAWRVGVFGIKNIYLWMGGSRMDKWMDGSRTDGWMEGWIQEGSWTNGYTMDRSRMDGWIDTGWMYRWIRGEWSIHFLILQIMLDDGLHFFPIMTTPSTIIAWSRTDGPNFTLISVYPDSFTNFLQFIRAPLPPTLHTMWVVSWILKGLPPSRRCQSSSPAPLLWQRLRRTAQHAATCTWSVTTPTILLMWLAQLGHVC